MINYYQVLEVSEDASDEVIKAAFKKKALLYHPDKNGGDPEMEERFKEINLAYQVLSNPYQRARYDLQLRYGQYQKHVVHRSRPYKPKTYKANDSAPEADYRENWIATVYAFGFTLVVAVIIMTGIGLKNYYDEMKREELLASRRTTFQEAQTLYASGKISGALQALNSLGSFFSPEEDMDAYKTRIIEEVIFKGQRHFTRREYDRAIYYYEVIRQYTPSIPLPIKENLALAYRHNNEPRRAVKVFTELLTSGYRNLTTYLELAEIHRDQLDDNTQAKRHFQQASRLAIEYYKAVYGEAYPLVVSAGQVPDQHYRLYTGLADIYYRTGDYQRAIKATEWNVQMWRDSAANYAIAAKSYATLNELDAACSAYLKAIKLDKNIPLVNYCE
ncbi:MAG: DnaJ domain-containing protein [Cyclobacteriaceae bacterium]|nr:DnaJ domain-containing protein [Cyclobacteriaceae bacterium HetDA_MAG_MS6]